MNTSLKFTVFAAAAALSCFADAASAQLALNTSGVYNQTFDTLPASGTTAWVNNVTLAGWYVQREVGAADLVASTGSSTGGALYSFGSAGSAERALGSIGSSTTGSVAWAVIFSNASAGALTFADFTYAGELWRRGATGKVDAIEFDYRIGAIPATDLLAATGWTAINTLDFANPNTAGGAGALDGNNAANRATLSSNLNLVLAPGQFITFRWLDIDQPGTDNGLAIDNVSISYATAASVPIAVPEASPSFCGVIGAMGALILQRRRTSRKTTERRMCRRPVHD